MDELYEELYLQRISELECELDAALGRAEDLQADIDFVKDELQKLANLDKLWDYKSMLKVDIKDFCNRILDEL